MRQTRQVHVCTREVGEELVVRLALSSEDNLLAIVLPDCPVRECGPESRQTR